MHLLLTICQISFELLNFFQMQRNKKSKLTSCCDGLSILHVYRFCLLSLLSYSNIDTMVTLYILTL